MRATYGQTLIGEQAAREQARAYGRPLPRRLGDAIPTLSEDEIGFIAERDSFYLGTLSENGWPYVQHRGGPKGFLKAIGPNTLAFADLPGNRQLISAAAVRLNPKVSLFLMDYVARERLKIIGEARLLDAQQADERIRSAAVPGVPAERYFVIEVVGYDWNCPKYITPRYTADQVEAVVGALKDRIAELEARLAAR